MKHTKRHLVYLWGIWLLAQSVNCTAEDSVIITAGTTNGVAGSEVLVPIRVEQFTHIRAFQFSLHWTPAVASYRGVEQFGLPGLAPVNFGTSSTNNGTLMVAWDDPSATFQSLSNGAALFYLRLQLVGSPGTNASVYLNDSPIPVEVANEQLQLLPYALIAGTVSIDSNSPRLRIAPVGISNVILAWPTNYPGFLLQFRASSSSGTWSQASGTPVIIATEYVVTNSISGNRFYRLIK